MDEDSIVINLFVDWLVYYIDLRMTSTDDQAPYFGKYQRLVAIAYY